MCSRLSRKRIAGYLEIPKTQAAGILVVDRFPAVGASSELYYTIWCLAFEVPTYRYINILRICTILG